MSTNINNIDRIIHEMDELSSSARAILKMSTDLILTSIGDTFKAQKQIINVNDDFFQIIASCRFGQSWIRLFDDSVDNIDIGMSIVHPAFPRTTQVVDTQIDSDGNILVNLSEPAKYDVKYDRFVVCSQLQESQIATPELTNTITLENSDVRILADFYNDWLAGSDTNARMSPALFDELISTIIDSNGNNPAVQPLVKLSMILFGDKYTLKRYEIQNVQLYTQVSQTIDTTISQTLDTYTRYFQSSDIAYWLFLIRSGYRGALSYSKPIIYDIQSPTLDNKLSTIERPRTAFIFPDAWSSIWETGYIGSRHGNYINVSNTRITANGISMGEFDQTSNGRTRKSSYNKSEELASITMGRNLISSGIASMSMNSDNIVTADFSTAIGVGNIVTYSDIFNFKNIVYDEDIADLVQIECDDGCNKVVTNITENIQTPESLQFYTVANAFTVTDDEYVRLMYAFDLQFNVYPTEFYAFRIGDIVTPVGSSNTYRITDITDNIIKLDVTVSEMGSDYDPAASLYTVDLQSFSEDVTISLGMSTPLTESDLQPYLATIGAGLNLFDVINVDGFDLDEAVRAYIIKTPYIVTLSDGSVKLLFAIRINPVYGTTILSGECTLRTPQPFPKYTLGQYALNSPYSVFNIGIGTSSDSRKNIVTVNNTFNLDADGNYSPIEELIIGSSTGNHLQITESEYKLVSNDVEFRLTPTVFSLENSAVKVSIGQASISVFSKSSVIQYPYYAQLINDRIFVGYDDLIDNSSHGMFLTDTSVYIQSSGIGMNINPTNLYLYAPDKVMLKSTGNMYLVLAGTSTIRTTTFNLQSYGLTVTDVSSITLNSISNTENIVFDVTTSGIEASSLTMKVTNFIVTDPTSETNRKTFCKNISTGHPTEITSRLFPPSTNGVLGIESTGFYIQTSKIARSLIDPDSITGRYLNRSPIAGNSSYIVASSGPGAYKWILSTTMGNKTGHKLYSIAYNGAWSEWKKVADVNDLGEYGNFFEYAGSAEFGMVITTYNFSGFTTQAVDTLLHTDAIKFYGTNNSIANIRYTTDSNVYNLNKSSYFLLSPISPDAGSTDDSYYQPSGYESLASIKYVNGLDSLRFAKVGNTVHFTFCMTESIYYDLGNDSNTAMLVMLVKDTNMALTPFTDYSFLVNHSKMYDFSIRMLIQAVHPYESNLVCVKLFVDTIKSGKTFTGRLYDINVSGSYFSINNNSLSKATE